MGSKGGEGVATVVGCSDNGGGDGGGGRIGDGGGCYRAAAVRTLVARLVAVKAAVARVAAARDVRG